jgi:pimeloyl-ACP methyl ester carboxylesterase
VTASASEPVSRRIPLGTGLTYHVLEWGQGRPDLDHTVVLLHGFLDLAWGWAPTVRAGLAARFHVIAPDFRGHGDSDWIGPGGYYHFIDYLADLHELLPQVARARVSLVGHSMGGSVAAYYAGSYPERIHRLALLEGMGPPEQSESAPERVRAWLDSWRRVRGREPKSYADLAEAAARLQAHDLLLTGEVARELAAHGTTRLPDGRLRFKHDPLHATAGPTPFRVAYAADFWRRVTCPVLLVEGEESSFRDFGEEAERRAAFLAHTVRAALPGAGHMMQRHQPATLADMLLHFLAA